MIDTQAHILDPGQFPYPTPCPGYLPNETETGTAAMLRGEMERNGVRRAVLVQPSIYGTDNRAILAAVRCAPDQFRAVVVVDNDPSEIKRLAAEPSVQGVRLNLTHSKTLPTDISTLRDFSRRIADSGLFVQVQGTPDTLLTLLEDLDGVPVLIDHFGRLNTSDPSSVSAIRFLADREDTWLKASAGFRLVPSAKDWRSELTPFREIISAFGPERVVWGSDWPFINHDGPRPSYRECLEWGEALIPDPQQADATAARLFGWDSVDGR